MSTSSTPSRMMVPQPDSARREALVLAAIVGVVTGLSIWGLATFDPYAHPMWLIQHVVAPLFWFGLVANYLWRNFTASGKRRSSIHRDLTGHLAPFSRSHFVEKTQAKSGAVAIRAGFQLFGRRFLFKPAIPIGDIVSVECGPGQWSRRSGEDLPDWYIGVWYEPAPSLARPRQDGERWPLHLGLGSKEIIADFGQEFMEFLRESGADLRASEGRASSGSQHPYERTYVRA